MQNGNMERCLSYISWTDYFFIFYLSLPCIHGGFQVAVLLCYYGLFSLLMNFIIFTSGGGWWVLAKHLFISYYYSCNWFGALEYSVFLFSLVHGVLVHIQPSFVFKTGYSLSPSSNTLSYDIHRSVFFFFPFYFLTLSSTIQQFGRRGICITESVMGRFPLLGVCILFNLQLVGWVCWSVGSWIFFFSSSPFCHVLVQASSTSARRFFFSFFSFP